MTSIIRGFASEVSDNWPAFVYIALMIGFSLRFLSERREEARILRRLGEEILQTIQARFDRLEYLVGQSNPVENDTGDRANTLGKCATVPRGVRR